MKKARITVMRTALCDDLIGWYENPIAHARPAMISCNDGFRPGSFLVDAPDEEAGA